MPLLPSTKLFPPTSAPRFAGGTGSPSASATRPLQNPSHPHVAYLPLKNLSPPKAVLGPVLGCAPGSSAGGSWGMLRPVPPPAWIQEDAAKWYLWGTSLVPWGTLEGLGPLKGLETP